ncbi:MAG: hypothetical protein ACI4SR_00870, partial [Faecalibacillus sp.]
NQTIREAYIRLKEAKAQLSTYKADKTLLEEEIKKAEALKEEAYTTKSWEKLEEEVKKAKEVYEDENAIQTEVDEMIERVQKAVKGLEIREEEKTREELEELTEKMKDLDKGKYTEDTWKVLEEKLDQAKEVLGNKEVTQEEINEAYKGLEEAYRNLELKKEMIEEPGTDEETKEPEKGVETGDQMALGMYATLAMLTLLGTYVLIRKEA